jgi:hypothetical protein
MEIRRVPIAPCNPGNALKHGVAIHFELPVGKGIARELEARGVRTPAGRDHWDAKQVSRLLAA